MYEGIKNDILGEKYSLSVAFVSAKKIQEINKTYRHKDKPTNILSFSLSKDEGEILLCNSIIKEETKERVKTEGRSYEEWLGFLVIHGMLHLKGMTHSSKMDRAQEFYLAKYDKKYFHRNRRGDLDDQGHRRRVHQRRKKS